MRYAGVAASESALDPDGVARLVGREGKTSPLDNLIPRELQALAQIAEGRSNAGYRPRTPDHCGRCGTPRDQHLRQARPASVARPVPPVLAVLTSLQA